MEFWTGIRLHIHFSPLLKMLEWAVCRYIVSGLHWILSWGTHRMPKRNIWGRYPYSLATHKKGWRPQTTCGILLVALKQSLILPLLKSRAVAPLIYKRQQNQGLLGSGRISQGVALCYSTDIWLDNTEDFLAGLLLKPTKVNKEDFHWEMNFWAQGQNKPNFFGGSSNWWMI